MENQDQMYVTIRERLTERLIRQIGGESDQFKNMSMYQLIAMLHLVAGHINYLPCWTVAVRSVEELVGEDRLYRRPNDTAPAAQEEPKVTQVIH